MLEIAAMLALVGDSSLPRLGGLDDIFSCDATVCSRCSLSNMLLIFVGVCDLPGAEVGSSESVAIEPNDEPALRFVLGPVGMKGGLCLLSMSGTEMCT